MNRTRQTTEEIIKDMLSPLGAKEIMFLYPSNMVHYMVVAYKFMKEWRCFTVSHVEYKITEGSLEEAVKKRFEVSLGSLYNSWQHTYTDQIIPKQTNSAT